MSLVIDLIAEQFPQWTHLPIRPVKLSGWDNRTFHLGEEMLIRLPSAEGYALQAQKRTKMVAKISSPHLFTRLKDSLSHFNTSSLKSLSSLITSM